MNRNSSKEHWVEGPVTYDFTLHLRVVTTIREFGSLLLRPLDTTFFWALTTIWSQPLAHV